LVWRRKAKSYAHFLTRRIAKGTFQKAARYLDWGIRCVWIIDGERRKAYVMSLERPNPIEPGISDSLTAGTPAQPFLALEELFDEVDKNLGAE
jgi:hypothetical protein